MKGMLRAVIVSLALLTLVMGLAYPLLVLLLTQAVFPDQAHGSLVRRDGRIVGSRLIGQSFSEPRYFWGRPSATTPAPYNASASLGSNLAASNPQLAQRVAERAAALARAHGSPATPLPLDLLTASGSGLDPHISVAAALYQVSRVAAARNLDTATVRALVEQHIERPTLGILGERRVNVLALNLALDAVSDNGGVRIAAKRGAP